MLFLINFRNNYTYQPYYKAVNQIFLKMKKLYILGLFCLLYITDSNAQSTLSNAGNESSNDAFSLTWTLGETAIQTLTGTEATITQGVLQHTIVITSLNDNVVSSQIELFPVPTDSKVYLKNADQWNYVLLNSAGTPVMQGNVSEKDYLDLEGYSSGIYILTLSNNDNFQSFKIIKK